MLEWEPNLDERVLRALPPELLRRELDLHIKAWEQDNECSTATDPCLAGIHTRA